MFFSLQAQVDTLLLFFAYFCQASSTMYGVTSFTFTRARVHNSKTKIAMLSPLASSAHPAEPAWLNSKTSTASLLSFASYISRQKLDHPNICRLHAVYPTVEHLFMVMVSRLLVRIIVYHPELSKRHQVPPPVCRTPYLRSADSVQGSREGLRATNGLTIVGFAQPHAFSESLSPLSTY